MWPVTYDAPSLVHLLDLSDEGDGRFIGPNEVMIPNHVYGGQILAQAAAAAARTTNGRPAHSMHAYFLRGGLPGTPIEYQVDRLSDGRSITHRRVQASQGTRMLFSSIVSFQADEPGPAHQHAAPVVPGPDDFAPEDPSIMNPAARGGFEARLIPDAEATQLGGEEFGRQALWLRLTGSVPEDPAFHQLAIAYVSDFAMFATTMKVHNVTPASIGNGTFITSLDHALWWHAPTRVDEWLLLVQETPQARGGRSMNASYFYSQDGTLVASVAQEILFRVAASA